MYSQDKYMLITDYQKLFINNIDGMEHSRRNLVIEREVLVLAFFRSILPIIIVDVNQ